MHQYFQTRSIFLFLAPEIKPINVDTLRRWGIVKARQLEVIRDLILQKYRDADLQARRERFLADLQVLRIRFGDKEELQALWIHLVAGARAWPGRVYYDVQTRFLTDFQTLRTRLVEKYSEVNLVLSSNEAIGAVKEFPAKVQGRISTLDLPAVEILLTNLKTATEKMSDKLPLIPLQSKWEAIKEKMPAWQNHIASLMQRIQDSINKKIKSKPSKDDE